MGNKNKREMIYIKEYNLWVYKDLKERMGKQAFENYVKSHKKV